MKKKNFLFKFGFLGACAISIPLVLTSCSSESVYSVKTKEMTLTSYNNQSTYSSLSSSNVNLKDAIYGSNFNDGNYIFIYGTTSSEEILTFLYANQSMPTYNESNINGEFFSTFYSEGNLGNGGLSSYNVKILMYIDIPPNNDDAYLEDEGQASPTAKYDVNAAIAKAQRDGYTNVTAEKDLPEKYRYLIDTYIRYDQKAIEYRNLVDYIGTVRSNMQGTKENGGIIAFRKDTDPKSFSVAASSYESIRTYYETGKN